MRVAQLGVGDQIDFQLLNDWQHDFPLEPRPFARLAATLDLSETEILSRLGALQQQQLISRIGAVFRPNRLGTSALAALAAPVERVDQIAARINCEPAVNHNYEREHQLNLWFVITADDHEHLQQVVSGIERDSGCPVIILPLEEAFHIDLGFDLRAASPRRTRADPAPRITPADSNGDAAMAAPSRDLVAALRAGLSLQSQPYAALGTLIKQSESSVLSQLQRWLQDGMLSRFGIVVRHHELGLRANAMCVWDVPDKLISELGARLATEPAITLCYRRRRIADVWRYNLFCMIHGNDRHMVVAEHAAISARIGLSAYPGEILFSLRRFKQTGASYQNAFPICHV